MNSTEPVPEINRIRYHRADGALPPPYHTEIEIELTRQGGVLHYWPDYPAETTPCWVTPFDIALQDWIQVLDGLKKVESVAWRSTDPALLGSAMEWLDVQEGGSQWQVPADLQGEHAGLISSIYQQIRSLVPESVWQEMNSRRLEYQKQSGY